ncbi:MAG: hypothetical protein EOP49_03850 [Sphingobacteriales bacterium]|nr:MAG: hypothetical protein EOP49_03850 [Sphingobacteriales bacterium]
MSHAECETRFRLTFAPVRDFVKTGLERALATYKDRWSKEDLITISGMIAVMDLRFYEKEELDRIILEASAIPRRY